MHSRSDQSYTDSPQQVTQLFTREADHYYQLQTEFETINVTAEHPLWVQGKGWTEVKDIKRADPIATKEGDVLVLSNTKINEPIQVHNFSVADTPNYFVGQSGIWAHNVSCDINGRPRVEPFEPPNFRTLNAFEKGTLGELRTAARLQNAGFEPVGSTPDARRIETEADFNDLVRSQRGQNGLDGVFRRVDEDGNVEYVIVESKTTGGLQRPDDRVCGSVDRLCTTTNGDRQLSQDYVENRLVDEVGAEEASRINRAIEDPDSVSNVRVTRVFARTDVGADGQPQTRLFEVNDVENPDGTINTQEVRIGNQIDL